MNKSCLFKLPEYRVEDAEVEAKRFAEARDGFRFLDVQPGDNHFTALRKRLLAVSIWLKFQFKLRYLGLKASYLCEVVRLSQLELRKFVG